MSLYHPVVRILYRLNNSQLITHHLIIHQLMISFFTCKPHFGALFCACVCCCLCFTFHLEYMRDQISLYEVVNLIYLNVQLCCACVCCCPYFNSHSSAAASACCFAQNTCEISIVLSGQSNLLQCVALLHGRLQLPLPRVSPRIYESELDCTEQVLHA